MVDVRLLFIALNISITPPSPPPPPSCKGATESVWHIKRPPYGFKLYGTRQEQVGKKEHYKDAAIVVPVSSCMGLGNITAGNVNLKVSTLNVIHTLDITVLLCNAVLGILKVSNSTRQVDSAYIRILLVH